MNNIFEQIEKNIDNLVSNKADWTSTTTEEQLEEARKGNLILKFFDKEIPSEWIKDIKGKKVLCLAGAGGLIKAGFVINGYMECQMEDITELHFMTRAIKC